MSKKGYETKKIILDRDAAKKFWDMIDTVPDSLTRSIGYSDSIVGAKAYPKKGIEIPNEVYARVSSVIPRNIDDTFEKLNKVYLNSSGEFEARKIFFANETVANDAKNLLEEYNKKLLNDGNNYTDIKLKETLFTTLSGAHSYANINHGVSTSTGVKSYSIPQDKIPNFVAELESKEIYLISDGLQKSEISEFFETPNEILDEEEIELSLKSELPKWLYPLGALVGATVAIGGFLLPGVIPELPLGTNVTEGEIEIPQTVSDYTGNITVPAHNVTVPGFNVSPTSFNITLPEFISTVPQLDILMDGFELVVPSHNASIDDVINGNFSIEETYTYPSGQIVNATSEGNFTLPRVVLTTDGYVIQGRGNATVPEYTVIATPQRDADGTIDGFDLTPLGTLNIDEFSSDLEGIITTPSVTAEGSSTTENTLNTLLPASIISLYSGIKAWATNRKGKEDYRNSKAILERRVFEKNLDELTTS